MIARKKNDTYKQKPSFYKNFNKEPWYSKCWLSILNDLLTCLMFPIHFVFYNPTISLLKKIILKNSPSKMGSIELFDSWSEKKNPPFFFIIKTCEKKKKKKKIKPLFLFYEIKIPTCGMWQGGKKTKVFFFFFFFWKK